MSSDKDSSDRTLAYMPRKDIETKLPRTTRVKNKNPATVQITAEQILREARETQEAEIRPPKQKITDTTDLSDYRLRVRKDFEDKIRRARWNVNVLVKYAQWEESQTDYARARSVWERAIEGDYRNHTVWIKYAEFEMKNKFVNSARNVWERAVTLLPRVDQLWCKYAHMEKMLGNIAGARHVFERWMKWSPDQEGWLCYINFELEFNEFARARSVYERFVLFHRTVSAYIRYAKFEIDRGEVELARKVYERASDLLGDEEAESLFVAFAEFEEGCKEVERARGIYEYALVRIPKERAEALYEKFAAFERRYGGEEGTEDSLVGKKRFHQYEDEVRKNPLNYDSWLDYLRLEEEEGCIGKKDRIREIYERAVANVPPAEEKRYWKRYIYLWINYALYEEVNTKDVERTRDVYRACLKLIPHNKFSFAKIWLLAAQFEIRQLNLTGARQLLGNAIGKAPKDKIFKKYIEMELQLANIDRCRKIYERYLEWSPENCYAWRSYAEFEMSLSEKDRARAIFELAISQPALDMPELLWKMYIDFEISEKELERTRALYERLLDRTKHYNVWVSFAKFEASADEQKGEEEVATETKKDCIRRARAIFERANTYYKDSAHKEERATLLEDWVNMEAGFGSLGDVSVAQSLLPKKLKKRKAIIREEDGSTEYQEYTDYLFPDESQTMDNLKIIEAAHRWKKQRAGDASNSR
ncbi:HAT (Half-A-TPR) repeat-containing protein [Hirschfeldia incana]|nr:HAT (Half-A-TPR) repeat-containing protein [Hirschfeldia incana]